MNKTEANSSIITAFGIFKKTISSELASAKPIVPKIESTAYSDLPNGLKLKTVKYADADIAWSTIVETEEYAKREADFKKRTGIEEIWWGIDRFDFDEIECERDIDENDIELLNSVQHTNYTLKYFNDKCNGKCLVLKNGDVIIDDHGAPLAGTGYRISHKHKTVKIDWMS